MGLILFTAVIDPLFEQLVHTGGGQAGDRLYFL